MILLSEVMLQDERSTEGASRYAVENRVLTPWGEVHPFRQVFQPSDQFDTTLIPVISVGQSCPGHGVIEVETMFPPVLIGRSTPFAGGVHFRPRAGDANRYSLSVPAGIYDVVEEVTTFTDGIRPSEPVTLRPGETVRVNLLRGQESYGRLQVAVHDAAGKRTDAYNLLLSDADGKTVSFFGRVRGSSIVLPLEFGKYSLALSDVGHHPRQTQAITLSPTNKEVALNLRF